MVFEKIDDYHRRAQVPGGWLVKVYEDVYINMHIDDNRPEPGYAWQVSMCFVPDPNHEWELIELLTGDKDGQ